ncbi:hypothetical protein PTI45_02297 [Paenibacillus nuruki]|jgi:hypothetical protein|uniref:Uncharacterized protein n=1 Tax=Paenibacillus nuruki TaxID=1886670 RepID=A0A1E3L3C4_9BACL|nr:hypothetical protein PTI45_02297 [Paenibacillus nuruki]CAJ1317709.1 Cytochrome-c oxidase [Paenibacillus nuruki]
MADRFIFAGVIIVVVVIALVVVAELPIYQFNQMPR